jgi:OOP family OmpA-OmpF porin
MKSFVNLGAAALIAAFHIAPAGAAEGYLTSGQDPDQPVRSYSGECVHTYAWREGSRFADCEPKPVEPVALPEPAPAPAPQVVEAPAPTPAPLPQNLPFRLSSDAFFDFDNATLRPEGLAALDDLVKRLEVSQYDTVSIVGHTDHIGTPQYNQKLSERRANALRDYLVGKGVPAEKIAASGLGEKDPVAKCSNLRGARLIACLQPDRYAEFTVSGTVQVSAAAGN